MLFKSDMAYAHVSSSLTGPNPSTALDQLNTPALSLISCIEAYPTLSAGPRRPF